MPTIFVQCHTRNFNKHIHQKCVPFESRFLTSNLVLGPNSFLEIASNIEIGFEASKDAVKGGLPFSGRFRCWLYLLVWNAKRNGLSRLLLLYSLNIIHIVLKL